MENSVVITRISETKRGRTALFCEQGFLFSLDEETWHFNPLKEGDILSPPELERLRALSDSRKAVEKALEYLGLREYGSEELYRKLLTKYDPHSAAAAVARMDELGLLDDERFARRRAEALLARHRSRREISQKLAETGIDRDVISTVLDELFAEEDEASQVYALLERQYASKLAQGRTQNVMAALARRGFGSGAIRDALEQWQEEHPEPEAEEFEG